MTDLESLGLSPDQIEWTEADLDRLIEAIQNEVGPLPWYTRIWWAILDALDFIRRLFSAIYDNSGEMVDPDSYGEPNDRMD